MHLSKSSLRSAIPSSVTFELPVPKALEGFKLPSGVQKRLKRLLDQQDGGSPLSQEERREAEGLVELADFLSLLKLRSKNTRQLKAK